MALQGRFQAGDLGALAVDPRSACSLTLSRSHGAQPRFPTQALTCWSHCQ